MRNFWIIVLCISIVATYLSLSALINLYCGVNMLFFTMNLNELPLNVQDTIMLSCTLGFMIMGSLIIIAVFKLQNKKHDILLDEYEEEIYKS
jgi:uncharacterized integral membrane protein